MWQGARIAVVIPAYREARLIRRTLSGVPVWVDHVIVVDDASPDATAEVVRECADPRVECLQHASNQGVGAAIVTGYRAASERGAELIAVMAGDAQMDPADLPGVLAPLLEGRADYVKGNRFEHREVARMPVLRRWAGRFLAHATNLATGLSIGDSQCGYTAIRAACLPALPLSELWPRYGYPNDLLALLAQTGLRVAEVPVRPVYADEQSGVRAWHVLVILGLLARRRLAPRVSRVARAPRRRSGGAPP
jgi:glycosyltransferase involved in cell wall biosynthesis